LILHLSCCILIRKNMHNKPLGAAVIGATGYTGQEVVALLARHPRLTASFLSSEAEAGRPVPGTGLRYVPAAEVPLDAVDMAFICLPHGDAGEWAVRACDAGTRVVDLSSDLRDGSHGAIYGLTEMQRTAVRGANLVANPGCYPTGALLALMPLLSAGLVDMARTLRSGSCCSGRLQKIIGRTAWATAIGTCRRLREVWERRRVSRCHSFSRRTCSRYGAEFWKRSTCPFPMARGRPT
jgi:N-acetyl-gamma-glutamyl-phosphate reductase